MITPHHVHRLICISVATVLPSLLAWPLQEVLDSFLASSANHGKSPISSTTPSTTPSTTSCPLNAANGESAAWQGQKIDFLRCVKHFDVESAGSESPSNSRNKAAFLKVLGGPVESLGPLTLALTTAEGGTKPGCGIRKVGKGELPIGVYSNRHGQLVVRILQKGTKGELTRSIRTILLGPRVRRVFGSFWDKLSELLEARGKEYLQAHDEAFNWLWKTIAAPDDSIPIVGLLQPGRTLEQLNVGKHQERLIECLHRDAGYEVAVSELLASYIKLKELTTSSLNTGAEFSGKTT